MSASQFDKFSSLSSVTVLGSLLFCPAVTTSAENNTVSRHVVNVQAVKKSKFDDDTNYSFERKLMNNAISLGYEIPNKAAISLSKQILNHLDKKSLKAEFINASEDGGVILEFYSVDFYLLVEIFNDEDIVLLKKAANYREAYDLDKTSIFEKLDELA